MAAFAPPYGRGTRGQHFTVFQSQPPGRQPFGLKVKSPRAFGPAPLPEGGLHPIQGPKRQPGTAANLVAGQAAGPLGKPFASQNCPQLYQGESGGLEPAMKPMAGQAGAPLHSLSPLRGPGGLPGQSLATFF